MERLLYLIVSLHVIILYLQTLSNQKHVSIQSESYLASNIHVVITALEKIKTAKAQTSSVSEFNTLVWEQRANFSA